MKVGDLVYYYSKISIGLVIKVIPYDLAGVSVLWLTGNRANTVWRGNLSTFQKVNQ